MCMDTTFEDTDMVSGFFDSISQPCESKFIDLSLVENRPNPLGKVANIPRTLRVRWCKATWNE